MPTKYKNNSRNSRIFKGCSPLQLSCKLKVLSSAIGYYSYTNRYQQGKKANNNKNKLTNKNK